MEFRSTTSDLGSSIETSTEFTTGISTEVSSVVVEDETEEVVVDSTVMSATELGSEGSVLNVASKSLSVIAPPPVPPVVYLQAGTDGMYSREYL